MVTFGAREQQDVIAAVRYLRERGDVDMDGLAILGYSLGAITAVLAAPQLPELRAIVIESGFSDLQRDIAKSSHATPACPHSLSSRSSSSWGSSQRRASRRYSACPRDWAN